MLVQILERKAAFAGFLQDELGGVAHHKILLVNAQKLARAVAIVGIEEEREVVRDIALIEIDAILHDRFVHGGQIEQVQPGIMKKTMVREAYYNQQVNENMVLIEVGSNNSTFEEVSNSVDVLAQGLIAYLSA